MCDSPLTVRLLQPTISNNGGFIYTVPVDCGKCLPCKQKRINGWNFRLMQLLKEASSAYFVTLTYGEDVPLSEHGFMTLKKDHVKLFMKRLRYYQDKDVKKYKNKYGKDVDKKEIKYYIAGEYGEERKRPHYHMIIFNLLSLKYLEDAWKYGYIHIDEVNYRTINYTLKYIEKESQSYKFKAFDGEKEFSLMSKGIGESYINNNSIDYYEKKENNAIVLDNGTKIGLPRYYRKKIYLPNKNSKYRHDESIKDEQSRKYKLREAKYNYIKQEMEKAEKKILDYCEKRGITKDSYDQMLKNANRKRQLNVMKKRNKD